MEKRIEFYPSWDRRDPDPNKNYGIGTVEIAFYLIGKLGAVQFKLSTGWVIPSLRKGNKYDIRKKHLESDLYPFPTDLGYHARRPQYEGQSLFTKECELIGGPCYYDGSTLQAHEVFDVLTSEGSEGVWKYLEKKYKEQFGDLT